MARLLRTTSLLLAMTSAYGFWGFHPQTSSFQQRHAASSRGAMISQGGERMMSIFSPLQATATAGLLMDRPIEALSSQETKQVLDRLFVKFIKAGDEVGR